MSFIFDESFQTCASEPTGVYLRPCEIDIEIEELSLESLEDFCPALSLERKDTADQEGSEIDEEEMSTPKRSYKQYCFGKEKKEQYKICNSLSRFNGNERSSNGRQRKRVNV